MFLPTLTLLFGLIFQHCTTFTVCYVVTVTVVMVLCYRQVCVCTLTLYTAGMVRVEGRVLSRDGMGYGYGLWAFVNIKLKPHINSD